MNLDEYLAFNERRGQGPTTAPVAAPTDDTFRRDQYLVPRMRRSVRDLFADLARLEREARRNG